MSDQYDRVLIRLSSAEDEKLEPILAKLLPLVFDELITQTDAAARGKIIGVLNHALTRAKGNKTIKLPVQGIAERWFSPSLATSPNAPFFRNLAVIFVDLGVPRLDATEQIAVALLALRRFGELAAVADRATLFLAGVPGLAQIAAEANRKEKVPQCLELIASRPPDDAGLAEFFHAATEFLLIPCGSTEAPSISGIASASWSNWKTRLKAKSAPEMVAMKIQVLKWLGALGAAPPAALVYLPSLAASVDNYDAVCTPANSNCARLDPELDLAGDDSLLGRLACAALTSAPPGCEGASGALRVDAKANVPPKFRVKVMALLQRAAGLGSKTLAPYAVHLVRQGVREQEQVQMASLQLAMALAERADPEHLAATSALVLQEIEAVFWPGGGVVSMGPATPLAFRVYGSFARKVAELPGGEGRALALAGAPRLLSLLASNDTAAQDILEALSGLVACIHGPAGEEASTDFVPLLDRLVASPKPVVRREVLRWASTLFPATAPEGRYYALRLFGDPDVDIARAAETVISAGRHEAPPFEDMCGFLATRALRDVPIVAGGVFVGADGQEVGLSLLASRLQSMSAAPRPALPDLASGFSQPDVARILAFLLGLATTEGVSLSLEGLDAATPPKAKRLRLSGGGDGADGASAVGDHVAPLISFLLLLDYLLAEAISGGAAAAVETVADNSTVLELVLRGILLATAVAGNGRGGPMPQVLHQVAARAELVLFGGGAGADGTLFREGGLAMGRARRLGALALGALAKHMPQDGGNPIERWFDTLESAFDGPAGSARRSGGVLAVCELLRARPNAARDHALCQKALGLLAPERESDALVIASACDGLRRLSERRRLVWDVLEAGGETARQSLLDHLYGLSKIVTSGLGDTKEAELGAASRELVHSSWRLLGQLAAWSIDGAVECVDRLVTIGQQTVGEEAAAALGLALAAACSDPAAAESSRSGALSPQAEALIRRLLKMVDDVSDDAVAAGAESGAQAGKAPTVAEREATQRCGIVWIAVLLRRLCLCGGGAPIEWLGDVFDPLCRALVRATSGLSIFTADCGLKALCYLYVLTPVDQRPELLKVTFASVSNRTSVSNMFVGQADTKTRRENEEKAEKDSVNSLKISAKERVDGLKDLTFLARDLGHQPILIALLDQPAGSVWTGDVFREALDLQSPCLPDDLREHLCPTNLRPKLYPFFFHNNAPLRQAVVKMAGSYFSCESPQQLSSKYPGDWPAIARYLIHALGSSRVATRQASIQAAQVLFRGRVWREVGFILEDLWSIVVKLMDDMEEGVQLIVKPLVRMLRNLTLRLMDLKLSKREEAEEAIKVLVPLLLRNCERFKHAQPLCFDVMREMVKASHGTTLLTPYVQDLVPPLLISLSMMEHDALQYYQFHINNADVEKGKELEAARVSNSRDSESMRLLRQLVPLVSAENAETLAPRTRDQLHRGVGANTRVGVCDFWAAVCAERPSAVPTGGTVALLMLQGLSRALLDASREVRSAAASCFASFARRSQPEDLTKVISERLMRQDQEYRTDDAQRSSFRTALARALWEVCRRCDDGFLEVALKAEISAKAFALRYSDEQEVRTVWEPLWGELCPTTSGGVERYYKEICIELGASFSESISRSEKVNMAKAVSALAAQLEKKLPRPCWSVDDSIVALHKSVLSAVQLLPVFDGNGALLKALGDLSALMYRRKRGESPPAGEAPTPDEASMGLPLVLGFCGKGALADRGAAVRAALELMSAVRVWGSLQDASKLYASAAERVDELQKELEAETREPGEQVPIRHRGKAQSPAEEFLTATLDLWTSTVEQCRREAEDEYDLEPPEEGELAEYARASLAEFHLGSLNMRLSVIRMWKRVFLHLKSERIAVCASVSMDALARIATAIQSASLDQRSERLRRPALKLAAALVADTTPGGGCEALRRGLEAAAAEPAAAGIVAPTSPSGDAMPKTMLPAEWLSKLDPNTVEQEQAAVAALRSALVDSK